MSLSTWQLGAFAAALALLAANQQRRIAKEIRHRATIPKSDRISCPTADRFAYGVIGKT